MLGILFLAWLVLYIKQPPSHFWSTPPLVVQSLGGNQLLLTVAQVYHWLAVYSVFCFTFGLTVFFLAKIYEAWSNMQYERSMVEKFQAMSNEQLRATLERMIGKPDEYAKIRPYLAKAGRLPIPLT